MPQPQSRTFDANTEANKLYDLSKGTPKGFQDEMDALSKNPAQYSATIKAMEAKEATREAAYDKAHGSVKLHELKIVHSSPNGPVKEIYSQNVSKENDVESALPKVHLYDGAPSSDGHAARAAVESPEVTARKAQAAEAQRINTVATGLLTELQNHDDKDFATRYNALSDADKVTVGRRIQQEHSLDRDQTLRIFPNLDGSIKTVDRQNQIAFITPGEFLNESYEKQNKAKLTEYCQNLSPAEKQEFFTQLQTEASAHGAHAELDKDNNIVIKNESGKKIYDSKPDNAFGKILHSAESGVIKR